MSSITIQETLLNFGEGRVVLASDDQCRPVLGVSALAGDAGAPVFVQIDRVTMLELERGLVDVQTAMNERCAGIVVGA